MGYFGLYETQSFMCVLLPSNQRAIMMCWPPVSYQGVPRFHNRKRWGAVVILTGVEGRVETCLEDKFANQVLIFLFVCILKFTELEKNVFTYILYKIIIMSDNIWFITHCLWWKTIEAKEDWSSRLQSPLYIDLVWPWDFAKMISWWGINCTNKDKTGWLSSWWHWSFSEGLQRRGSCLWSNPPAFL